MITAGLTEIAALVRRGEQSAVALVEEHLARLHERNPELNAVIAERADGALADARRIDRAVDEGSDPGPLAGLPFTAKDTLATADLATTCGSRTMAGHRTGYDATSVARARAAGAVLVGKTNTPEFAFGIETANDLYGRTVNPRGPYTTGGSSGGEAVAVAAGFSAFGIGSDYGGSIRWPAQCLSLIGLRPTVGRIPGTGQLPGAEDEMSTPNPHTLQGLVQVVGPLARTADDAAAVLAVLAGPDGHDASAVPARLGNVGDVDLAGAEIRWGTSVGGVEADAETAAAVAAAAASLGRLAKVELGLPGPIDEAGPLYSALREADPLAEIRRVAPNSAQVTPYIRSLLESGPRPDADRLRELWGERDRLVADLATWLRGDRLLLLPVAIVAPFPPAALPVGGFDILAPSRAVSLFGLPAVSVPCGQTASGAPLAAQLVAPVWREDLALAAARVLEQAD